MARTSVKGEPRSAGSADVFAKQSSPAPQADPHIYRPIGSSHGVVCDTERRGQATPRGRSPLELVLHAPQGFIPLWDAESTLQWCFRRESLAAFADPAAAEAGIRTLFGEALLAWGDAAPVRFAEAEEGWDFEIVVRNGDNCTPNGCVLASAFFPDAGRHQLVLYPKMFTQPRPEQVETLCHEVGHIFGLRHFFANVTEKAWPVEIFGTHKAFSIMNYGHESTLTEDDKTDLKRLYAGAWSGALTHVNGTPIKLVRPFHTIGTPAEAVTAGPFQFAPVPMPMAMPMSVPISVPVSRAAFIGTRR